MDCKKIVFSNCGLYSGPDVGGNTYEQLFDWLSLIIAQAKSLNENSEVFHNDTTYLDAAGKGTGSSPFKIEVLMAKLSEDVFTLIDSDQTLRNRFKSILIGASTGAINPNAPMPVRHIDVTVARQTNNVFHITWDNVDAGDVYHVQTAPVGQYPRVWIDNNVNQPAWFNNNQTVKIQITVTSRISWRVRRKDLNGDWSAWAEHLTLAPL
jgi:hypothetical protein